MHRRSTTTCASLLAELKECSATKNLQRGRVLHEAAVQSGDISRIFVANTLIHMYGKCGSLVDAGDVFHAMRSRTVVSWTALIMGYAENGQETLSFVLFSRMESDNCIPTSRTFSILLQACTSLAQQDHGRAEECGRVLHLLAARCGEMDLVLESILVDMYAKLGNIAEARQVFDLMELHDVVSWTSLISGYADNGKAQTSLEVFSQMDCAPNTRSFVAALKACTGTINMKERLAAVQLLAASAGQIDIYVDSTLVDLYSKCGSMDEACIIFERSEHPGLVAWNALILGYVDNGHPEMALDVFSRMKSRCEPDEITFIGAFKACSSLGGVRKEMERGKAAHLLSSSSGCDSDLCVGNTLVDMYAKCRSLNTSRKIFNEMQHPNLVSWTSLMLGYADNGDGEMALDLFSRMGCAPDNVAFVAALKACVGLEANADTSERRGRGKALHLLASCSGRTDAYVESTLVDMYAKCGCMEDARRVFDRLKDPDVVLWNVLISGYVENAKPEIALDLLWRMETTGSTPDALSFLAAVSACTVLAANNASLVRKHVGKAVHSLAMRRGCDCDTYVANALIDMYAKSGSMECAINVFVTMKKRDVISWNSLMLGHVENGDGREVVRLFEGMKQGGCEPDMLTFHAVLKACCMLGALEFGKSVHSEISARGLENEVTITNGLVNLYAKCGSLREAQVAFDPQCRDLVTWTALMAAYSRHGNLDGVFHLFGKLQDVGLQPDQIVFMCVLTACSHAGLVDKAHEYLESMSIKYGVEPDVEHYTCMLDMLGRANRLDETMELLRKMPFTPDSITWATILAACRKWKYLELGRLAFESMTSLDNKNAGAYVLMANTNI